MRAIPTTEFPLNMILLSRISSLDKAPSRVWIPGHDDGDSKMIVMAVPK